MTAIIDYGTGNLFSLMSALSKLGIRAALTADRDEIDAADRIILPGVGAFGDAAALLQDKGLFDILRAQAAKGKPIMGICLGMQLLFEKSFEFGEHDGLGLIPGEVKRLPESELKIPHMGWNSVDVTMPDIPMMRSTRQGEYFYFVHSYYASCDKRYVAAYADYGVRVPAVVRCENVYGAQFHPEKSGDAGLKLLSAFCDINGGFTYDRIPRH